MNINHVAKFSEIANGVGEDKMMTEEVARLLDDEHNSEVISIMSHNEVPGYTISIPKLAILSFCLLFSSHVILARQCVSAIVQRSKRSDPILRNFKVITNHTSLPLLSRPGSGSQLKILDPGDDVVIYNYRDESDHCLLLEPAPGFIEQYGKKGNHRLEPLEYIVDSSLCPLEYEGWLPRTKGKQRYTYAPTSLVVAQQLWNAAQVFQLFLLLLCEFDFSQRSSFSSSHRRHSLRKWILRMTAALSLFVLPFSVYLISPGARIFAFLSILVQSIAIYTSPSTLRISISEKQDETILRHENTKSWKLSHEETVACFCNLGSSLYNYAGSIRTWPHWKRHFYNIDALFGWPDSGDCTVKSNFTMGIFSNLKIPLYVARATGSTTGAQVFLLVWSILPFLYVLYFLCMFALAPLSPGVKIQRALCIFGIFHFLFFTDVVAYRYGRGMHSPHGEFFHWTEKWAWRIAMLLPIYQNCTNGHWERGHSRIPYLGRLLRWILMIWFMFFILFQVIQSDIVKFGQFLLGKSGRGLIEIIGLEDAPFFRSVLYPYREALVTMIIFYGIILRCCGFKTFGIFIGRVENTMSQNGETEQLKRSYKIHDEENVPLKMKP